jgi:hypothetical protein
VHNVYNEFVIALDVGSSFTELNLVLAHGAADEAARAKNILSTLKPNNVTDHVLEPAAQAVTRCTHREVGINSLGPPPHATSYRRIL